MHHRSPILFRRQPIRIASLLASLLVALPPAFGQIASAVTIERATAFERASVDPTLLPEAPVVSSSISKEADEAEPPGQIVNQKEGSQPSLNPQQRPATPRVPTPTDVIVAPGQIGPRQTPRDKLAGSLRDSISPFSIAGEIISAGYSQAIDRSPNYGTDAGAFGQRIGASFVRGTSQKIFSEGALAALLREDPRYYQLGSKQKLAKRILYAGTRPVIGRTDGGRSTINLALLGGYLGASALAQTYYPERNQGFGSVFGTWGTGVGGAAIGDEISEFLPDVLQFLHLKRVSHY